MLTVRLAWRNLWRNRRRTVITVAAVALNTAVLIASYGLMDGMVVDTVHNITYLTVGDAQAHAPGYRREHSLYQDLQDPQALLAAADRAGIGAAPRAYGFGLVSSGSKSAGARFWGVVPARELQAFELARQLRQGRFLDEVSLPAGKRPVVLGNKLARSLHATVGSELVAVVQAVDGSLGNELFTVVGVLKTAGEDIDRTAAIIRHDDFAELFVSGGRVHEIAFNARGRLTPEQVVTLLQPAAAGAELLTWKKILPQLADMVQLFDAVIWIFGLIFMLAAALGVVNTLLMSTFERIHEFGVLKALGAGPLRIVRDVAAEAFLLALLSTLIGVAVGVVATVYLQHHGIDLSGLGGDITFGGVAFNPIWRATLTARIVWVPVVSMWLVCVLAALYPAAKAARLNVVRALTHV